jgi:hypothetical protein
MPPTAQAPTRCVVRNQRLHERLYSQVLSRGEFADEQTATSSGVRRAGNAVRGVTGEVFSPGCPNVGTWLLGEGGLRKPAL